jgi:hypothetical protein
MDPDAGQRREERAGHYVTPGEEAGARGGARRAGQRRGRRAGRWLPKQGERIASQDLKQACRLSQAVREDKVKRGAHPGEAGELALSSPSARVARTSKTFHHIYVPTSLRERKGPEKGTLLNPAQYRCSQLPLHRVLAQEVEMRIEARKTHFPAECAEVGVRKPMHGWPFGVIRELWTEMEMVEYVGLLQRHRKPVVQRYVELALTERVSVCGDHDGDAASAENSVRLTEA